MLPLKVDIGDLAFPEKANVPLDKIEAALGHSSELLKSVVYSESLALRKTTFCSRKSQVR